MNENERERGKERWRRDARAGDPPQECHCALQYPQAMSKVIKGLRSRLRLKEKTAVTAKPLERERAFLSHTNHIQSTLARACTLRSCTQAAYTLSYGDVENMRAEIKARDSSLTRKDGPVHVFYGDGLVKMCFIRPTSQKSQVLSHLLKGRRDEKMNVILQPAALANSWLSALKHMLKMNKEATWGIIECLFDVVFSRGKYKLWGSFCTSFRLFSVVYWCVCVAVFVN